MSVTFTSRQFRKTYFLVPAFVSISGFFADADIYTEI